MVHDSAVWGEQRRAAQAFPLLCAADESAIVTRAKSGDRAATRVLVESHMRLVVSVAARYSRSGLCPDDLIAEGTVGLLEALKHFELGRDCRFSSYAAYWVRAYVARYAAANRRIVGAASTRGGRKVMAALRRTEHALAQRLGRWPSRSELAEALEVDELEVATVQNAGCDQSLSTEGAAEPPDERDCPEDSVTQAQLSALRTLQVSQALTLLNERERSVVSQQMAEDAPTFSEIARGLGVSRQRAGQIMANARDKLRRPLMHVA